MSPQAHKVIRFIESFLTLGGSFAGQPFILLPFQREIIADMYRTSPDGRRLRRRYLLGLPRKNGKSQLGAALALFHLVADTADARPLVISAAGDRKQARLVFEEAVRMVQASPELSRRLAVLRHEIRNPANGGVYKAVSADAGLQHGLNPSTVIFDELHVFKNADLLEALTSGSAMRSEPLFVVISTAGTDLDTPLGRLYQYGLRVDGHLLNGQERSGELSDPAFGMTWYGPELELGEWDPDDPELWREFNPAGDLMPSFVEYFESQRATMTESAFIRFHLNGWTSSEDSYLPSGSWEACDRLELEDVPNDRKIEKGELVVLALDAAWKGDSTALTVVSLEDFHTEVAGHWEAPPTAPHWRTPVLEVEEAIRKCADKYKLREFVADPYRFERSLAVLADEGLPVVEFPTNSVARMVPACLAFSEAVIGKDLSHNGDPALARHLAACRTKEDARGVRVTKEHPTSKRKIDLAVSAIIGQARARAWRESASESADARIVLI